MKRYSRYVRICIEAIGPIVLGCVLAGAALSKIFSFQQFAATVSRLSFVPLRLAPAAAAALIVMECATGLLLLARKSIRVAASGALGLFLLFTFVLSAAIFRGVDLPCDCFGVFGPHLPARAQAALDLICAVLAMTLARSPLTDGAWSRRSLWYAGLSAGGAVLWGALLTVWPHPGPVAEIMSGHVSMPSGLSVPQSAGRPAILLLADFDDFACQLCLDDFLAFCDSLNTDRVRNGVNVRLVARRDSARSAAAQIRMLEGWSSGNGYLFPVSLDSANLFENSGVGKTSAIVTDSDGRLLDIAHFPTGSGRRDEILHALFD